MTEHAIAKPDGPLQWRDHLVDENGERLWSLDDRHGQAILVVRGAMREDYAAFIVRACNAHDDLVEACKGVLREIEAIDGVMHDRHVMLWADVLRAALAKAKGSGA